MSNQKTQTISVTLYLSILGQDLRFEKQEGSEAAEIYSTSWETGEEWRHPPCQAYGWQEKGERGQNEGAEGTGDAVQTCPNTKSWEGYDKNLITCDL